MSKLVFVLSHYAWLAAFVFACWGYGQLAIGRSLRATPIAPWLGRAMVASVGIGIAICALQVLGIAGLLTPPPR